MLICPEASSAQNSIAAVSADGSTVCVLIRRLNSSCSRSIALVVLSLHHWLGGSRVNGAPSLGALAAHALDREQHLLTVLTYPEDDEQRDRGRLAVEPHPHHRAVENEANDWLVSQRAGIPGIPVALRPAHRILRPPRRTAPRAPWRTRRVLAPARYVLAISASAASVRR
jgi:hypothetical protein